MKKITLNPFDKASIDLAIEELKKHQKWREEKSKEYVKALAEIGAEEARESYGKRIGVTVEPGSTEGSWKIHAHGKNVVFFEFGAGIHAAPHRLSAPLPIDIEPGSWSMSEEGSRTWEAVITGEVAPENYKYNREPRHGMLNAYTAIEHAMSQTAKDIFK